MRTVSYDEIDETLVGYRLVELVHADGQQPDSAVFDIADRSGGREAEGGSPFGAHSDVITKVERRDDGVSVHTGLVEYGIGPGGHVGVSEERA